MMVSTETWAQMHAVNLEAGFHLARVLSRKLIADKAAGSFLLLTSLHAGTPRNLPHYSTAKAGLAMLVRELAKTFGRSNIRVNALVPGAIVTDRQTTLHRDPAADKEFLDAQCLKIRLDPGHVARATLFLAADDSDGMTGQHVLVDGGIAQQSVVT